MLLRIFRTLVSAGVADICTQLADRTGQLAVARHVTCSHAANLGAIHVKRNASNHCAYVGFLQAGCSTVVTRSGTCIAGFDAGLERRGAHGFLRNAWRHGQHMRMLHCEHTIKFTIQIRVAAFMRTSCSLPLALICLKLPNGGMPCAACPCSKYAFAGQAFLQSLIELRHRSAIFSLRTGVFNHGNASIRRYKPALILSLRLIRE